MKKKVKKSLVGLGVDEQKVEQGFNKAEDFGKGLIDVVGKIVIKDIPEATKDIRKDVNELGEKVTGAVKERKKKVADAKKAATAEATRESVDALKNFGTEQGKKLFKAGENLGTKAMTLVNTGVNAVKKKTEKILNDPEVKAVIDDASVTFSSLLKKGEGVLKDGNKFSENVGQQAQAKVAKTLLKKRIKEAALKAGFTPAQATALSNDYFSKKGALTQLISIFPDKKSEKLQDFLVAFYRKTEVISLQTFAEEIRKPENNEILLEVLGEVRISIPDWYGGITDERLDDFFSVLFSAYQADVLVYKDNDEKAFELTRAKVLIFI
ncbi:MAG: hypothetical protein LBO09_04790 [Candidatus Peribacteria bacterium]|nr:hypothetical protein [Candidatus Peribacteria bacterium]